jgi:hypothetical protein
MAQSAAAVPGAPVLYECTLEKRVQNHGWIDSPLVIVMDEQGRATVNDPAIFYFNKAPLAGVVERDAPRRLIVTWSLEDLSGQSSAISVFRYRASLSRPDLSIDVTARADTYDNRYFARGTCKKRMK